MKITIQGVSSEPIHTVAEVIYCILAQDFIVGLSDDAEEKDLGEGNVLVVTVAE